ncbi:MAG: EscU/YscU/HrcU family type III secretion system export apparatus switch protein [bacterium]|nr:EscU/YscU/HrcU family type III secretion system export apparatus switch protein [bacterium]MCP4966775.1 EscU/YscU/HrcU family type III secretion system export apparatus switch protein [bacterium]
MEWLGLPTGVVVGRSSQDRTEKPTERKKREARREGRVPKSQEVGVALSMVFLVLAIRLIAPGAAMEIASRARAILSISGTGTIQPEVGIHALGMITLGLLPFLLTAAILGIAGGIGQVGFTVATKAAKPKLSNLSLKKGLNRFKPSVFVWELVRAVMKVGLLVLLIWGPLQAWMDRLGEPLGIIDAIAFTGDQVWQIVIRAAGLAVVVAGADYAVTRYRQGKELKMTKQETREEYKSSEGDPMVRSARRQRAREMSRNRMIFDVATADVVITNPTRLAIALKYDADELAPRIVAKGASKIAARIRAEARRNGVPLIENKPLARTLYRRAKIGGFVPANLFEAVAAVLAVAYRRRPKRRVA